MKAVSQIKIAKKEISIILSTYDAAWAQDESLIDAYMMSSDDYERYSYLNDERDSLEQKINSYKL